MNNKSLDIFTGTANPELAQEVSKILGIRISDADVGYFSDGEIKVQIEENVRGHDTFIIQSTCSPTNKNVMEIMLIADALKRSSAMSIQGFCVKPSNFQELEKTMRKIVEYWRECVSPDAVY